MGVIGGTGSGKSSLVNLIPRFYDATGGQVLVNGRDVRAWEPQELRRRIGVVPQKAELFAGSIRDNLKWGDEDADDAALLAAAEAAQAGDVVRNKGGLDAWIEQHGRNLSGGQRQRLTIARALVRRLVQEARAAGYQQMRLDTFPFLKEAIALYKREGFYEIPRYNQNPMPGSIYLQCDL